MEETRQAEDLMEACADLLSQCGLDKQAVWFLERASLLRETGRAADALEIMSEVYDILAGMGSFSDLSLRPARGSGMTEAEARDRQWTLTENLGQAITEAREAMESRTNRSS